MNHHRFLLLVVVRRDLVRQTSRVTTCVTILEVHKWLFWVFPWETRPPPKDYYDWLPVRFSDYQKSCYPPIARLFFHTNESLLPESRRIVILLPPPPSTSCLMPRKSRRVRTENPSQSLRTAILYIAAVNPAKNGIHTDRKTARSY